MLRVASQIEVTGVLRRLPVLQRECLIIRFYADMSESNDEANPGNQRLRRRGTAEIFHRFGSAAALGCAADRA